MTAESLPTVKLPRLALPGIYAFPPNRDTLGGTAYFIVDQDEAGQPANLLIDCPAWQPAYLDWLTAQGGVRWLLISHRDGISRVRDFQNYCQCAVVIQEQEAYLLPQVAVTPFQQRFRFSPTGYAFWTPGYSPGSSCLYLQRHGGVLFSGRHLLPDPNGIPGPLRFAKTFHWPRQLQQVQRILAEFTPETLTHLCPGANTGFLRGQTTIPQAFERLQALAPDPAGGRRESSELGRPES
jgi:glyoxylase-like metal-dependent hydrolase (beta-lactamase superfamily II)